MGMLRKAYEYNPGDTLLVTRLAQAAFKLGNEMEFQEWKETLGLLDPGALNQLLNDFGLTE